MKSILEIQNLSREEREAYLRELLEQDISVPYTVFAAMSDYLGHTISNKLFINLLPEFFYHYKKGDALYGDTSGWLNDECIQGYIYIRGESSEVYFLSREQVNMLQYIDIDSGIIPECNYFRRIEDFYTAFINRVRLIITTLSIDEFYPEEMSSRFNRDYMIPENSLSTEIDEHTSRFSGALWYEEIQKKTIILAGLGGIGSYVCFLLSRMQPTSMFIYDDDIVEAGNMSGQLYSIRDVGRPKVDSISDMVSSYANYNSVFAINSRFTASTEATDIMICGFDNMEARKIFFDKWVAHVESKEDKSNCLFIDGRLSAEYLQVYAITGDDAESLLKYNHTALFSDDEADETICSYKQTTYMANMIGSIIVNIFTNFVANQVAGAPIREVPYFTSYDGNSMQLKLE